MPKNPKASKPVADGPAKKPPGQVLRPEENDDQQRQPVMASPGKNLITELYTGMVEQTYTVSPYVPNSMLRPYNPDDLFRKRNDYGVYEEMAIDDQVSICLQLKKDLVLGAGWDIVVDDDKPKESEQDAQGDPSADPKKPKPFALPGQGKPQDPNDSGLSPNQQIKRELEVSLQEQCEGDFDDMLAEILTAYDFGFSLTEKVFKLNPDGKLGLKYLRTRHPASWLIHTDEQGVIEKYEQRVGAPSNGASDVTPDPKSLIHYINNPKFQNPYGTSDLRPAYNAYFVKRQVIKYFAIFLEKAASPIPWAQYEKNAPQQAIADIYEALKSFQAKTALVVPKDLEVAFLEAKNTGEAYASAINIFNMFIGRALFVPDLIGLQGGETGGGSYALGKDQIRIFMHHIARRRRKLENIVNLQLIRPMVLFNYGEMENYPKFRLKPIDDELAVDLAKMWLDAVKGSVFKPNDEEINFFRALCKFPEGEVQQEDPAQPTDPTTGMPMHPNDPRNPNSPTHPLNSPDPKVAADAQAKAAKTPLMPPPEDPKKKAKFTYTARTDFALIESQMDDFKDRVTELSVPIVRKIFRDLYAQIQRAGGSIDKLENVDPKRLDELKSMLQSELRAAHERAMQTAAGELDQKQFKARKPLPDDQFLNFLDGESSIFVNDWAENMTKAARSVAVSAIRDGRPLSAVFDVLDDQLFDDAEVAIERFARTKFTDVMNKGRVEYFNSTGQVAAYQFSAILDDRTSDICEGLHGKIFNSGDEPIPPLHWNCRSLLLPITKYEDFDPDTEVDGQPIGEFIDQNKGKGFPTK